MDVRPSPIPGCVELVPPLHRDDRGIFAKPFHASTFETLGLESRWREHFYSVSARSVVRGLHFQLPPAEQAKLVCCVAGEVLDVVVDLRAGSPTFGKYEAFPLDAMSMTAVFAPVGLAHGFAALTDGAVVAYAVSSEHDPDRDSGIRWDSVPGIPWPNPSPLVSQRDAALPPFESFVTPFVYEGDDA